MIDSKAQLIHALYALRDELEEAYTTGTLNDLLLITRRYREIRDEAEDNGVCVGSLHAWFSRGLCEMIDLARDEPGKVEWMLKNYPSVHEKLSAATTLPTPANAHLLLAAMLRNTGDEIDLLAVVGFAMVLAKKMATPDFLAVTLSETLKCIRKIERNPVVCERLLLGAMEALDAIKSVNEREGHCLREVMTDLIDLASEGESKTTCRYTALAALMLGPFRDVAEAIYEQLPLLQSSPNIYTMVEQELGLKVCEERILDELARDTDSRRFAVKAVALARFKLLRGDTEGYEFLTQRIDASAAKANLPFRVDLITEHLEKAPIAAMKALAETLVCAFHAVSPAICQEAIEALSKHPQGKEIMHHLRGNRKTSRQMIERDMEV